MPYNRYIQISEERYEILMNRFKTFIENIDKFEKEPTKLFDPLSKKHLEELEVIREVSRELALKKDEDLKKADKQKEADEKTAETAEIAENVSEVNGTEKTPPATEA